MGKCKTVGENPFLRFTVGHSVGVLHDYIRLWLEHGLDIARKSLVEAIPPPNLAHSGLLAQIVPQAEFPASKPNYPVCSNFSQFSKIRGFTIIIKLVYNLVDFEAIDSI